MGVATKKPARAGKLKSRYGAYGESVVSGLKLRHDHGSQYLSDAFQKELKFVGIVPSPAFVRAPEGNGCSERIIRTLKEQLLWLKPFRTVEELRLALLKWKDRYNRSWLIERHAFLSPEQARRQYEVMHLLVLTSLGQLRAEFLTSIPHPLTGFLTRIPHPTSA